MQITEPAEPNDEGKNSCLCLQAYSLCNVGVVGRNKVFWPFTGTLQNELSLASLGVPQTHHWRVTFYKYSKRLHIS